MKPLLIGECNPYSSDPKFALYPLPKGASGHRLCTLVLGLNMVEYLRRFDRVDLCVGKRWNMPEARAKAHELENVFPRTLILLGSKVCAAFRTNFEPFTTMRFASNIYVKLPHPSGRNSDYWCPGSYFRARQILREVGAL